MRSPIKAVTMSLLPVAFALIACGQGKKGADVQITVEHPLGQVIGSESTEIPVVVTGIDPAMVSYGIEPAGVAVADAGQIRCLGTGSGMIMVTAGERKENVPFECLLVGGVQVTPNVRSTVGDRTAFPVEVTDTAGAVLPNPKVDVTVSDESVVKYDSGYLLSLKAGRADVTATAYGTAATTRVEVSRKELEESFEIVDGSSKAWDLPQGNFDITIRTQSKGPGSGVSVRWEGARCGDLAVATSQHTRCSISSKARIFINNPMGGGTPVERGRILVTTAP